MEPHSLLAPYSVQMQENMGHKNSEYKHFLRKGLVTWIGYIEHKDWLHWTIYFNFEIVLGSVQLIIEWNWS